MNKIRFSSKYPKLWGQKTGRLLSVELLKAEEVHANRDLIEYDTKYIKNINICYDATVFDYDYFLLPKSGSLIQLVFLGDKGIPFCTIRTRYGYDRQKKEKTDKYSYYKSKIGQEFEIEIKENHANGS